MSGATKLMTSSGGGVSLTPATTTATDVTVKVPVTGVNNGTLVCSDSSGNVGIGTSSPSERLGVLSTLSGTTAGSNVVARFQTNGNGYDANITFGDNVNASTRLGYLSGNMYFWTNGAERMRIDSSGNLLVGTTSTGNTNKIGIVNTGQVDYGIVVKNSNTNLNDAIAFINNSNTRVGVIQFTTSATTYATSSDYRLKENIQPMQNALAVVQQLKPVTYTWKADGSDGQGFIAHELQAVVPDCVTGEKDAVDEEGNPVYQGIDTSFLVATLTKAIQELSAKNDALEARLAALESK